MPRHTFCTTTVCQGADVADVAHQLPDSPKYHGGLLKCMSDIVQLASDITYSRCDIKQRVIWFTTQRPMELKDVLPEVPRSGSFGVLPGVSKMVMTRPNGASLLNPPNQVPLKFPRRGHSIEHESSARPCQDWSLASTV